MWVGSRGPTQSSIASTLRIQPNTNTDAYHIEFDKIINKLNSDRLLKSATKIFLNQEFNVTQQFEQFVQTFNFNDVKNVTKSVNTWVKDYTNGKIQKLIDDNMIRPDTIMVLLNALYFKGLWKNPFTYTREDDFTNIDGSKTRVTFMSEIVSLIIHLPEYNTIDIFILDTPIKVSLSSHTFTRLECRSAGASVSKF